MPFAVVKDMGLRVSVVELAAYLDGQLSKPIKCFNEPAPKEELETEAVEVKKGGRPRTKLDRVLNR